MAVYKLTKDWIVGFTDGEGCFYRIRIPSKRERIGKATELLKFTLKSEERRGSSLA